MYFIVSDEPVIVKSSLGKLIIIMGKFKFNKDNAWGNKVRYRCNKYSRFKCKACIIITTDNVI